ARRWGRRRVAGEPLRLPYTLLRTMLLDGLGRDPAPWQGKPLDPRNRVEQKHAEKRQHDHGSEQERSVEANLGDELQVTKTVLGRDELANRCAHHRLSHPDLE